MTPHFEREPVIEDDVLVVGGGLGGVHDGNA